MTKNDEEKTESMARDSGEEECCPCNRYVEDELYIGCEECETYWHLQCVSLNGLTEEMVKKLECWLCPECYVNPRQRQLHRQQSDNSGVVSNSSCSTIRTMLKTELNLIIPVIRATIKDAVQSSMGKEQSKIVEAVNTIVDSNVKKSYAAVTSTQQKIIEEVKSAQSAESSKKVVQEICRKIDSDSAERQKRATNVMISNAHELNSTNTRDRRNADMEFLTEIIGVESSDIDSCFRAGVMKKDEDGRPISRPLIVKMKSVSAAEYWHDNGKGFKVSTDCETYWINADLCKADREAQFFARQERRARKPAQKPKPNQE